MSEVRHKRRWFGPKQFGWGARPTSWEGWAVVAAFGVVLAGAQAAAAPFIRDLPRIQTMSITLGISIICVAVLLAVVWLTYGPDE